MIFSKQIEDFELKIPPLMQKSQIPGLAIELFEINK